MSNRWRGAIYGLSAAAIWGGMYVVSDVVLRTIPPFTLLTIRLVLGIAVLLLVLRRLPNVRYPQGNEIAKLLGVGVVGFGISVAAQFVGTDKSNAVNGSLVTSASPAFILIFAAILLREKLTVQRIAAVALATLGVLVIIDLSKADFSSDTFAGNVALAVASVTWGLYSVLVRRVSAQLDTLVITLFAFLGGLIVVMPAAFLELPNRPVGTIDAGTIAGILYLGIISTAGAMWLWNRAFALVDASIGSLCFFAQPLVGAVLGALLLHEPITPNLWAGGLLIGLGLLMSLITPQMLAARRGLTTEAKGAD
jgi:drug/metabolite transporter (DMT)-like permease